MPLELYQTIILALGVVTLASGLWLLLHARDVARVFRREPDVAVGPGVRQASRLAVSAMLIVFNLGWLGALVFWGMVI